MSTSNSDRSPRDAFRRFNGETYGEAHGFDQSTGDFVRSDSGNIQLIEGPPMVAQELVRTLQTPIGDDPFRPDFGLDKKEFLGNSEYRTKAALIDAIGPDADPRVGELGHGDITVTSPDGSRDASVTVRLTLVDGTPLEFSADFRALLGVAG
ncbi:hypothetical protein [Halocatena halophila]|uniref:hypothetical protein n=1 Tax=Halocatena halophila TaxID=2814576 RepID=UPI002ED63450